MKTIFTDLVALDHYSSGNDWGKFRDATEDTKRIHHAADCAAEAFTSENPLHYFKRSATDAASAMLNSTDAIPDLVNHLMRRNEDGAKNRFFEVSIKDVKASYAEVFNTLKVFDEAMCGLKSKIYPTANYFQTLQSFLTIKTNESADPEQRYQTIDKHNIRTHERYKPDIDKIKSITSAYESKHQIPADFKKNLNTLYSLRNPACKVSLSREAKYSENKEVALSIINRVKAEMNNVFHFEQLFCDILSECSEHLQTPNGVIHKDLESDLFQSVHLIQNFLQELHPAVLKMANELHFEIDTTTIEPEIITAMYQSSIDAAMSSTKAKIGSESVEDFIKNPDNGIKILKEYGGIAFFSYLLLADGVSIKHPQANLYNLIVNNMVPSIAIALMEAFRMLVILSFEALLDSADEFMQETQPEKSKVARKKSGNPRKFSNPLDAYETTFTPAVKIISYDITGSQKQQEEIERERAGKLGTGTGKGKARHYVRPHFAVLAERILKSGEVKPTRTIFKRGHWRGSVNVVRGTIMNVT